MTVKEMLSNQEFVKNNDFARQMVNTLERYGQLTERQADALERCFKGFEKYQRIVAERRTIDAKSEYMGEVGQRLTVEAVLEGVFGFDTRFGWNNVFVFRTADGNLVKWITGSVYSDEFTKGGRYEVTGTVKKHDEYRGAKQTVLTRCKVFAARGEEAEASSMAA